MVGSVAVTTELGPLSPALAEVTRKAYWVPWGMLSTMAGELETVTFVPLPLVTVAPVAQ